MVSQAALALVLLVGAGLMLNSFVRLVRVDPGFPSDQLLTIRFDLQHAKYMTVDPPIIRFTPRAAVVQQQLLERIETLPEVDSVGLSSVGTSRFSVSILGRPETARTEPFRPWYREISPDYMRTLQIQLLKGRVITARDGAGAPGVAIINETMARQFLPGEDPIGVRVQADLRGLPMLLERQVGHLIGDTPRTIVGVVGDVKHARRASSFLRRIPSAHASRPTCCESSASQRAESTRI